MADIAAMLKEAITNKKSDAEIQALAAQRDIKLKDNPTASNVSTADLLRQYGYSAPTAQTTQPIAQADSTNEDRINELIAAHKAQQQTALMEARNTGLSSLNKERETIAPRYYNDRNAIASTSALDAKRLTEMLAKSGLGGSGASGQLMQQNYGQLQGNLANSKTAESNAFANIDARATDLNNQYNTGLANANAQSEIARMQSLIDQSNQNRNYNLQAQGQAFNQNMATNQFNLASQGQAFNQNLATNQFNQSTQQQQFAQQMATKQFEEAVKQNGLAQSNWQQQFSYQQAQDIIKNQLNQGQLSIQQANVALQQAKFMADQDPNSIDNQIKQAQLQGIQKENALIGQSSGLTPDSYIDAFEKQFVKYDNQTGQYNIDKANAWDYINNLYKNGYLNANQANSLAAQYGIYEVTSGPNANTFSGMLAQ